MDFKKFLNLIMIEQTLFALPFAYIGVLFAGGRSMSTWFWVTIALFAARTSGMSFNRVIDAKIDAKNPRTKERLIPKGEVKPFTVWIISLFFLFLLIFSSYMLNKLCFYLSFIAGAMLFAYSYFKRFSSSSHFFLGFVEACAPIGGYLAVTGEITLFPLLLGLIILTWIAGIDILYATQDMDFDKKENLKSIPAKLGKEKAVILSGLNYFFSIIFMILAGIITKRDLPYWIGIIFIGLIFIRQQQLGKDSNLCDNMKKIFKLNAYISPLLFLAIFIDIFIWG
ncbi:MAG: UbiA family prenyltransferase [Desulfobacterales bacterium]|nr:UbiA family prenyltransferase [Desulfobacterales bacterium]